MESVVEFYDVKKIYRNKYYALKNINLNINKGEFIFLVGPSGAGKTTLLKLIYMEELPEEGKVKVLGFSSKEIKRKDIEFLRRKIGVVFQDFRLLPDRNALENVTFSLEIIGVPYKEAREKSLKVLTDIGLIGKVDSDIFDLSGGEKQKVCIARALVREPIILIADEPTGNIDPESQDEIIDLLVKIHSKGTTVIMATHNHSLMEKIPFKKTVYLERGEIKKIE
jgi:cell division transport system ATP-binding protein